MIDKKGTSPVSKGHFEQDRYWVSPYNFVPEVREGLKTANLMEILLTSKVIPRVIQPWGELQRY